LSNTYFADLSFSYSGSEVFPEKNRFGIFPSASAAWMVSNESWMENVKSTINSLKVRASYGLSGSDMAFSATDIPGRIFYNQYYTSIPGYTFGKSITTGKGGVGESRLANPDIKWETSYIANIGIETDLFNCLNLSFDYYSNNRKDILTLDKSMNALTGIINNNVPYRNGGEVNVTGFDLSLNYFKKLNEFELNLGGMLSYSKNTVIRKDDEVLYANPYSNAVGHQIGQQFGLVSNGFFNSTADINASTVAQNYTPLRAGDVRYMDQNNDKLIDSNDRTAIGYSEYPQFVYSINGGLKFKQFDMSFLFQGTANSSTMLSGVFYPFNNQGNAFDAIASDSWTPNNTTAKYPRLTTLENANNYRANDIWSASLDYIKLRNVEIGYSIPKKTAGALKMTSLRVFAKGMNLFTIAKDLENMDPESLTGYPTSRVVTLGVSFKL
jgi:TonB-linked SusC/RagA family outer membrane protein